MVIFKVASTHHQYSQPDSAQQTKHDSQFQHCYSAWRLHSTTFFCCTTFKHWQRRVCIWTNF